jgi:GT2 family glycosyltransferase
VNHPSEYPPWTAICPLGTDEHLEGLVCSLVENHPDMLPDQIVVVWDRTARKTRREFPDLTWVKGAQPFVFARNVNKGVAASHPLSDIVIIGDDVRVKTPNAIDHLAAASRGCAAIAPAVNGVCGQPAQHTTSRATTADWLAFICVYIPRHVWDLTGPLDERFVGYGYDDVDWCKRASPHGELRVAHDVTVDHLPISKWRSDESWLDEYKRNQTIFKEKWESMNE